MGDKKNKRVRHKITKRSKVIQKRLAMKKKEISMETLPMEFVQVENWVEELNDNNKTNSFELSMDVKSDLEHVKCVQAMFKTREQSLGITIKEEPLELDEGEISYSVEDDSDIKNKVGNEYDLKCEIEETTITSQLESNLIYSDTKAIRDPDNSDTLKKMNSTGCHQISQYFPSKEFYYKKCNKYFTCKGNLKRHQESVHDKLKPYNCPDCGQSFYRKHKLKPHFLLLHPFSKSRLNDGKKQKTQF